MKRIHWMRFLPLFLLPFAIFIGTASALDKKAEVLISAGSQARDHCPILVPVPKDSPLSAVIQSKRPLCAISSEESAPVSVWPTEDGYELAFIINGMKPWTTRTYQIVPGTAYTDNAVAFKEDGSKIEIAIGGKPFTVYDSSTVEKKKMWPNFYPLFGPNGVRMTRAYPMETVEGESHDHPHHQSLWVSHGDINGISFWELRDDHGYTQQQTLKTFDGPAAGRLCALMNWTDHSGKKVFEEERTITLWGTSDTARMIDFDMLFKATEGDVKFGDTKEGGLIALRVAETMNEKQKEERPGGVITNAYGATGMKDCWGKPAPWCDYSGPAGGITVGLTIMDFPANPFYPIRYHVRDYGLFGANPFGLSNFIGKGEDGSRILKQGESWRLRFRIYIHAGDVNSGRVKEAYGNFADAPLIKLQ